MHFTEKIMRNPGDTRSPRFSRLAEETTLHGNHLLQRTLEGEGVFRYAGGSYEASNAAKKASVPDAGLLDLIPHPINKVLNLNGHNGNWLAAKLTD